MLGPHEMSKETLLAVEEDILERQKAKNGLIPFCPQCFLHYGEKRQMEVRYSTLQDANEEEIPHEDVTWKCGECQSHMDGSIRIESAEEWERIHDLRKGRRFDPVKGPEDPEVRMERMKALGYR